MDTDIAADLQKHNEGLEHFLEDASRGWRSVGVEGGQPAYERLMSKLVCVSVRERE